MRFLGAVAEYGKTDYNRNEERTGSTRYKYNKNIYQMKWLGKLFQKAEDTRDFGQMYGRNSFTT